MTSTPGFSFAIPSKYAVEFLDSSKSSVANKYRYLGMKMLTLSPQIRQMFEMQPYGDIKLPNGIDYGCLVVEVAPNSPAQK
jgi:S1-C subfamily serine protease